MKILAAITAVLLAAPTLVLATPLDSEAFAAVQARAATESKDVNANRRRVIHDSRSQPPPYNSHVERIYTNPEVPSDCAGSTERRCQPQKRFNDVRAISGGVPPAPPTPPPSPPKRSRWLSWLSL